MGYRYQLLRMKNLLPDSVYNFLVINISINIFSPCAQGVN